MLNVRDSNGDLFDLRVAADFSMILVITETAKEHADQEGDLAWENHGHFTDRQHLKITTLQNLY